MKEYYSLSELADLLGKSKETLLCKRVYQR